MDRLSAVVGMHQRATAPHAASGATGGLRTLSNILVAGDECGIRDEVSF
jgi:hypothetical protein